MPQGANVCPSPSTNSVFITWLERQWIQRSPLSPSLFYQTLTRFSAVNKHPLFRRRMVFHFTTFYFPLIFLYPILFYLFSLDLVYFRFWSMRWVTTLHFSDSDASKDFTVHLLRDSSHWYWELVEKHLPRKTRVCFVCFWRKSPQWARASSFTRFLNHTQRRTTVGRTPLEKQSAPRRDFCLTTHTTLTTDKHLCHRWDSNPQSQQASGRRPTP